MGIENPDETDGLLYMTSENASALYDESSHPIEAGLSIVFTTGMQSQAPVLTPVTDLSIQRLATNNLLLDWSPSALATSYRVEHRTAGQGWMPLAETVDSEYVASFQFGAHEFRVIAVQAEAP